jgi:phage tail sheath protein FI
MAETLLSPGVFLNENDLSQITQGPVVAGAAIMGPTVIGPVNTPTVVTTYSQYKALFGSSFISGGNNYEYLTSLAALNYFEQGGQSLLVTRVASGSYTAATSSVPNQITAVAGNFATASIDVSAFTAATTGSGQFLTIVDANNNYYYVAGADFGYDLSFYSDTIDYGYFSPTSGNSYTLNQWTGSLATYWNTNSQTSELRGLFTIKTGSSGLLQLTASNSGPSSNGITVWRGVYFGADTGSYGAVKIAQFGGASTATVNNDVFVLETLSVGSLMNNVGDWNVGINGALPSGSSANIRWEVTGVDTGSGVFSLIIRRGDDYNNSKTILETWTGLSLDPNQNNYIAYVIGDQTQNVAQDSTGNYYLQLSGSYSNKSKYVRVKAVNYPTPNYFDANGVAKPQYTGSFPSVGSGSVGGAFGGAQGAIFGSYGKAAVNFFEAIPTVASTVSNPSTNIQGVHPADYSVAINLLSNTDAYDFNVIYAPGLTSQNASAQVSDVLSLAQNRGDNIAVIDMVGYGQSIAETINQAVAYDNSYGATYWPWVQIRSRETGKINFVPASTLVPAVYEYNDKVSAEWFAPAGLNRGALSTVLRPERKLTVSDRNVLYQGKVNPIATFPGVGTVIYGQKTLQQKPSALDRVNVRRLLIALKSYIGQLGENIVFEPNTQVTRNKFLNQVNPYLESVQQRQGLYAFQVVMDETNNTPDVVDRNQLVGTIYLQPTKTAEFIQLDFNILPTGTSFGQ